MEITKTICTHNGSFHVDEVLACAMLTKHTEQFRNSQIVRSRDPTVWSAADILVDVGGEYIPEKHKFDHHQREFQDSFSADYSIRLSSAGLIYKHFGREVVANIIAQLSGTVKLKQGLQIPHLSEENFEKIYLKVYRNFIQSIDAVDNGVNQYTGAEAKYPITTSLSAVIGRYNPYWIEEADENQNFLAAVEAANKELVEQIKAVYIGWYPGRRYVLEALQNRHQTHESGSIIKLDVSLQWKSHFYELEKELQIEGQVKFILYTDKDEGWRIQDVGVSSDSFDVRKGLLEKWRGVKDGKLLIDLSGIPDIVFVHATGFIGGAKSYESALKMGLMSL